MKKNLFFIIMIAVGIMFSGCSKKSDSNSAPSLKSGTYPATGTITLTADGVNYSMPMNSVQIVTTGTNSILINAQDTVLTSNMGSIVIQINKPLSSLTTGTYTIPGSVGVYNIITFMEVLTGYEATPSVSNTSGTINITTLTSTSIKGTFTATCVPLLNTSGPTLSITNGVIDCTY